MSKAAAAVKKAVESIAPVAPPQTTELVVSANRMSPTLWSLPEATHDGVDRTPGYYDRVTAWMRMRARLVPVKRH